MIYILDDDQQNAIINLYKCNFVFDSLNSNLSYFKNETDILIDIEKFGNHDFVCFHNSFPEKNTNIIVNLKNRHDSNPNFFLICFSGHSSFFNASNENKYIKIHKDRFYHNLSDFIDSNFEINKLLFGKFDKKNEANIISRRMNNILFNQSNESLLDLKDLQPKDLKRICELAVYNYTNLIQMIDGKTIGQFKSIINLLIKNI